MFNKILAFRKASRLTCAWVATGNPRNPLTCVWVENDPRTPTRLASSPNDDSGRMTPCA